MRRNRGRTQPVCYHDNVRVQVLFFGLLRDIAGQAQTTLELPAGATAGAVFDHFAARFPALGEMKRSVMLARNQEFAAAGTELAEGDEIALLPPVSGGSGPWIHQLVTEPKGNFYGLTREPIDAAALARQLLQPRDGAFVNFEGVVRDNTKGRATKYLDYECYEAMAIKLMAQIGDAIAEAHPISRIALVHRLGRMEIGETSVAVIAFSPHRKPAFDAALEGINKLKKLVPIWKKEYFVDGEVWVDGEWDESLRR
jgi:molybdopterin converting factor subunit 1